jgi:serine/threonine-protein kinase HipA
MGALEFAPGIGPKPRKATTIAIDALVQLASDVLTHRSNLQATFAGVARVKALNDILQVGKSARLLAARAPRR